MIIAGLSTRVLGPTSAPTIVFLHGGGVGGWSWDPVVERLSHDYHCLIPDLPEHGQSAKTAPFSIGDAARRVAHLIEQQAHGGQATVVGLSLGGQIGLALLGIAPHRVARAVLSGVLVRPIPGRRLIAPLVRLYFPLRTLGVLVRANMRAYEIPERFYEQFWDDTRQMTLGALTRVLEENSSFRVPPGLGPVAVPTLTVVGEREPKVMRESACAIVAAIAQAEGRLVGGVGHNWNLTAPARFAQMVDAWINGQPLPEWLLPLAC